MREICLVMMMPVAWAFQPAPTSTSNIARLVAQSNFIFQGTVVRLNGTTEPQVPASASTAVVLVEHVLAGENMVSDIAGKEITVQLSRPRSVAAGRRVLFFSNVAVLGKSLAVAEVTHFDVATSSQMAAQVTDYLKRRPEQALQSRVAGADLIVTGTVSNIRRAERQGPPHPSTIRNGLKRL